MKIAGGNDLQHGVDFSPSENFYPRIFCKTVLFSTNSNTNFARFQTTSASNIDTKNYWASGKPAGGENFARFRLEGWYFTGSSVNGRYGTDYHYSSNGGPTIGISTSSSGGTGYIYWYISATAVEYAVTIWVEISAIWSAASWTWLL